MTKTMTRVCGEAGRGFGKRGTSGCRRSKLCRIRRVGREIRSMTIRVSIWQGSGRRSCTKHGTSKGGQEVVLVVLEVYHCQCKKGKEKKDILGMTISSILAVARRSLLLYFAALDGRLPLWYLLLLPSLADISSVPRTRPTTRPPPP